jgi:hypothetical protein
MGRTGWGIALGSAAVAVFAAVQPSEAFEVREIAAPGIISAQGVCRELIFAGDVLTTVCKNRIIIKVDSALNVDVAVNLDDSERGTIEFVGLRAVRDGNSYSALQSGVRWHTSGPLLEVEASGVCRFSSLGNGNNRITCSSVGAKKRAFKLSFDTKGD